MGMEVLTWDDEKPPPAEADGGSRALSSLAAPHRCSDAVDHQAAIDFSLRPPNGKCAGPEAAGVRGRPQVLEPRAP
jgi:hypothetical protein